MKKIYATYKYILIPFLLVALFSCGEPDDMVEPQPTCDTMAMVQKEPGRGIQLVLEDGRIVTPTNAKTLTTGKEEGSLEIGGFPVKEGQQIIIGYTPTAGNEPATGTKSEKKVEVNCIVGVAQKAPF